MATVCVVGTTSWGTTLATVAAQNGHMVNLLSRTKEEAERINHDRVNERFFPEIKLPESLQATSNIRVAISEAELVLIAVPSYAFKENLFSIKNFLCCKSHLRIHMPAAAAGNITNPSGGDISFEF